MVARNLIRSGYDYEREYTFRVDGEPEDLSAATIEASLVSEDKQSELITDTAQSNVLGSWVDGRVVIRFPAASTTNLSPGRAWIEVAAVIGGIRLPYDSIPVIVEKGWTT